MNAKTQPAKKRPVLTRTAERGFTLVEIMVVIVILGLLATLVVPEIMSSSDEAKEQKALTDVKVIAQAVSSFYVKNSSLPETLEDLIEPNEKGFTYLQDLPTDPWNNEYELIEGDTRRAFEVISYGPDGSPQTEDDISSKSKRDRDR